ncbi:hypothetical protein STAS_24229 [Striga asiatica]|uniref:Uncharacterized protein n=1 Tax=Striga asiatica TaxID=4170 RepID=A0A5A7QP81_STRAF|nr:hypothetical protein STAS_24229 [Striga asiatica]
MTATMSTSAAARDPSWRRHSRRTGDIRRKVSGGSARFSRKGIRQRTISNGAPGGEALQISTVHYIKYINIANHVDTLNQRHRNDRRREGGAANGGPTHEPIVRSVGRRLFRRCGGSGTRSSGTRGSGTGGAGAWRGGGNSGRRRRGGRGDGGRGRSGGGRSRRGRWGGGGRRQRDRRRRGSGGHRRSSGRCLRRTGGGDQG